MQIKDYLIDTFHFNDVTNKKLLSEVNQLNDKG